MGEGLGNESLKQFLKQNECFNDEWRAHEPVVRMQVLCVWRSITFSLGMVFLTSRSFRALHAEHWRAKRSGQRLS